MKNEAKINLSGKLIKLGVIESKVKCEESLRAGFMFGLWTRNDMKEVPELDYLDSFFIKLHVDIEEFKNLENDKERFDLIAGILSERKEELKL